VFPKPMAEQGFKLVDDAVVILKARVDGRDEPRKLIAMEVTPFEPIPDGGAPVRISLRPGALDEHLIEALKRLIVEHPGDATVFLHVGDTQVLRLPEQYRVDASNGLVAELRVLFGPEAIVA